MKMRSMSRVCALLASGTLVACGGGGGSPAPTPPPPPPTTYSIGGSVAGLSGSLILQNNGGDNLTVTSNGPFTFATRFQAGATYAVTILTTPAGQRCAVTSGTGTVSANVTTVAVACQTLLAVTATTPAGNAIDASRNAPIDVTFSAPISSAGLAAAVSLTHAGSAVPFTATATGSQLRIQPSSPLLMTAPYLVNLANTITGANGEVLANPFSFDFRTADGAWHPQTAIEPVPFGQSIDALSAQGDPVGMWVKYSLRFVGGDVGIQQYEIWVRLREQGQAVDRMVWKEDGSIFDDSNLALATNRNGDAIAVWASNDGALQASRYVHGGNWSARELLGLRASGGRPQVVLSDDGAAMVAWSENLGTGWIPHARRYAPGSGWEATVDLSGETWTLVGNAKGDAMVVSRRLPMELWVTRFSAASGWAAPERVDASANAFLETAALDGAGNAMIVWTEYTGVIRPLANYYSVGHGWSSFMYLADEGDIRPNDVCFDGIGNAFVIFDSLSSGIAIRKFSPATGWSATETLDSPSGTYGEPRVDADAEGNAIAVWSRITTNNGNPSRLVRASRYRAGAAWGQAGDISDENESVAPDIQMLANGDGVAWWKTAMAVFK